MAGFGVTTEAENERLQILGFSVKMKQAVIANDHVVAVFYDLPRREFSVIESKLRERLGGPTEENLDSYTGRDGCKGKEIHWRNEVSDIVLIDQCENDKYGAAAVNLFYTRGADFSTNRPNEGDTKAMQQRLSIGDSTSLLRFFAFLKVGERYRDITSPINEACYYGSCGRGSFAPRSSARPW